MKMGSSKGSDEVVQILKLAPALAGCLGDKGHMRNEHLCYDAQAFS